jgi:hypothetical protein
MINKIFFFIFKYNIDEKNCKKKVMRISKFLKKKKIFLFSLCYKKN